MVKALKELWRGATKWYFILFSLLLSGQYLLYTFLPYNYWFHYDDVKPAGQIDNNLGDLEVMAEFCVGEETSFISYSRVDTIPLWMEFHETEYCNFWDNPPGVYSYFGDKISRSYVQKIRDKTDKGGNPRFYQGPKSNKVATCYMKHNITGTVPLGIKKTQTIIGDKYTYVECSE
jgi:hypothetical protein